MTTAEAIAQDLRDYADARDEDVGFETGMTLAMRDGAAEIDRLRAEVENLGVDSDAYQDVVKVMVDYWFAQSSMALSVAVQKLLDENEALREAGEGLDAYIDGVVREFAIDPTDEPPALAAWRKAAGKPPTLAGVSREDLYGPVSKED